MYVYLVAACKCSVQAFYKYWNLKLVAMAKIVEPADIIPAPSSNENSFTKRILSQLREAREKNRQNQPWNISKVTKSDFWAFIVKTSSRATWKIQMWELNPTSLDHCKRSICSENFIWKLQSTAYQLLSRDGARANPSPRRVELCSLWEQGCREWLPLTSWRKPVTRTWGFWRWVSASEDVWRHSIWKMGLIVDSTLMVN